MKNVTVKRFFAVALAGAMALTTVACGQQTAEPTKPVEEQTTEDTTVEETEEVEEVKTADMKTDLKFDGYNLVWEDNFDSELNENDWNYELHEPGWVNNELQEYVKSDENVFIKDGKLVIKPVVGTDENGNTTYTSGRVNTQGKHDFKYGIIQASIKMPKGKGFLPAFWMMPTDENLYGQWPRCGEIDIAEVLGDATKTAYGTIHYGNPHNENQSKFNLKSGDFSSEFHNYAVEWKPGEMIWYVDGEIIGRAKDWYTATEGLGEVTFPAPFDQPFYIILNLAVGGNWPGNPDDTTDFDKASMEVDYVKVYQMDEYDENVEKPVKIVNFREPNEDGNYVNNANFEEAENLADDQNWKFLIAKDGAGEAEIKDNSIVISSTAEGTEDYAVQLIQSIMPMKKGCSYRVTFDAWADEARQMKVAVTAPEAGWIRYLPDTSLDLTTEKQTYTYDFDMTEADDPYGRLEFNMGHQGSCATIHITNVRLEMTAEGDASSLGKGVLSDGNYVYNSKFQEGPKHLGSWEFTEQNGVTYEVTPLEDGRRLHINVAKDLAEPFTVHQMGLGMPEGSECVCSFDAEATSDYVVVVGGNANEMDTATKTASIVFKGSHKGGADDLIFRIEKAGDYYFDNVRIEENVMIKNGSFNAGMSGYEVYVDSSAAASYVVDSLSEDNALDFSIEETGSEDWKIQLKQNNVCLENGHTYTLTFDAKSDISRKIRAIMQGNESKGWAVYSEDLIVDLTSDYQTFTVTFTMEADTDPEAFLSICLGAVDGISISKKHRVCIDNISLVEV